MNKKIYLILSFIIIYNFSELNGQNIIKYTDNDWKELKSTVNINSLLWAGGWMSGMYALSYGDEYLNSAIKPIYTGKLKYYFDAVDYLGYGPFSIPFSLGFSGFTFLLNDKKLQAASLTSVESVLASSIVVYVLKISIGRKRPYEDQGSHVFNPFSGWDDSFPSGHSSTAFALITPFAFYYDNPLSYSLLLLPVSTAISRMIFDKHWATDVLTGGAIGFVIGYYLTKWHKDFSKSWKTKSGSKPMVFSFSFPI